MDSIQHAPLGVDVTDPTQWRDMNTAPKDNSILELKVDYTDGDHPLHDATIAPTIGFNSFDDSGEDEWKFAGWCWCNDHFVQGKGKVVAWRPSRLNASDDGLGPTALSALSPAPNTTAQGDEAIEHEKQLRHCIALLTPVRSVEELGAHAGLTDRAYKHLDGLIASLPQSLKAATTQADEALVENALSCEKSYPIESAPKAGAFLGWNVDDEIWEVWEAATFHRAKQAWPRLKSTGDGDPHQLILGVQASAVSHWSPLPHPPGLAALKSGSAKP